MKKIYVLGVSLLLLLTGCGQEKTSDEAQPVINKDTLPIVTDIPMPEKDLYPIETEKPEKELLSRHDVTWEDELTFLYQYKEGKKTWFELAKLQPDDTWEISTPEWGQKFVDLLKKQETPLTGLEVCSDGSYFAMIQSEDSLPVIYHIMPDGTITEEALPDDILQWTDRIHEIVQTMFLTEKNEIVFTTFQIPIDENTGEPMTEIGHGAGDLVVYNPYTKKLVSRRECVDGLEHLFFNGDYVFCETGTEIHAYLLEGGGIQSVYTTDELQKKRKEELAASEERDEPVPHEEQEHSISFCDYSGGKYAYWFTDLGIYRLDLSQVTNAENTAEKIISSDAYSLPEKPVKLSMTGMTCMEDGKTTTLYTEGYYFEEKKVGEESFLAITHGPALTRYIYRE